MSVFHQTALKIAQLLAENPRLGGVPVIVERQSDVESELRKAVSKHAGAALVIEWVGAENDDDDADGPRMVSTYTATLHTKPILRGDHVPADVALEAIALAIHDYRPEGAGTLYHDRWRVTQIRPLQEKEGLVLYQAVIEAPLQL